MTKLYADLRGKMRSKELRISDMARLTGVSTAHLNNVLTGRTYPKIDLCYDILKHLDEPAEMLFVYFPPGGKRKEREDATFTQKDTANRGARADLRSNLTVCHVGTGRR